MFKLSLKSPKMREHSFPTPHQPSSKDASALMNVTVKCRETSRKD